MIFSARYKICDKYDKFGKTMVNITKHYKFNEIFKIQHDVTIMINKTNLLKSSKYIEIR